MESSTHSSFFDYTSPRQEVQAWQHIGITQGSKHLPRRRSQARHLMLRTLFVRVLFMLSSHSLESGTALTASIFPDIAFQIVLVFIIEAPAARKLSQFSLTTHLWKALNAIAI